MGARVVKLSFLSPVHFGDGRLEGGKCACDAGTLFSALYIEALRTGEADGLLAAARSGELALSDAFPYAGDTLYLPKPMVAAVKAETAGSAAPTDPRERKANKKLAYIPAEEYPAYLEGRFDALKALDEFHIGAEHLQTKVNLERRDTPDAQPYFVGAFSFAPGAGLYFLVRGSYDLEPLLGRLGYSGLGGKRTSGYGRFEHKVIPAPGPLASRLERTGGSGMSVLLATAGPSRAELTDKLLEGARYRLVRRGGFVQSATHAPTPQKRRDLYLFAAGSVFAERFAGDVFDVNATPGAHPVYRYARAFWMGV